MATMIPWQAVSSVLPAAAVIWADLERDRSANRLSASVGRAERIIRSNRRKWSGGTRPSLGGAEELPAREHGRQPVHDVGIEVRRIPGPLTRPMRPSLTRAPR